MTSGSMVSYVMMKNWFKTNQKYCSTYKSIFFK